MLIKNWRDAGLYFENEGAGGSGDNNNNNNDDGIEQGGSATLTAEQLKAELEQVRKALKAANKEAADRRKKLDEIEAADVKRKDAELGEVEAAKKRADEAERKAQELAQRHRIDRIQSTVTVAALKLDFIDAEDAAKLADLSGVEMAEDGRITGVEDALKALAKAKPHLIKQPGGSGDINARERGRQTAPTIEEIAKRKAASGSYVPF